MPCLMLMHWTLLKQTSCDRQVRIICHHDVKQPTFDRGSVVHARMVSMVLDIFLPIYETLSGNWLSHLMMKSNSFGCPSPY